MLCLKWNGRVSYDEIPQKCTFLTLTNPYPRIYSIKNSTNSTEQKLNQEDWTSRMVNSCNLGMVTYGKLRIIT